MIRFAGFSAGLIAATLCNGALSGQAMADSISVSPTNLIVPLGNQQTVLTVQAQRSAQSVI
jgi:P pilus assembly chaperone PapD